MKKSLVIASAIVCAAAGLSLTPLSAHAAPAPQARDGAAASTTFSEEGSTDGVDRSVVVDGDGPTVFGTIVHPEGGEWHYGVTGVLVKDLYSDYYHPSKKHGSSVYNGNGTGNRSEIVSAGTWSRSKVHHTFVGNQAFYRFG